MAGPKLPERAAWHKKSENKRAMTENGGLEEYDEPHFDY